MSNNEIILELVRAIKDLSCLIDTGRDGFCEERLKNIYEKMVEIERDFNN